MVTKARIAVFVSGGGTNLEALLRAQEQGQLPHGEIVLVCASNESAYALTRAADHGVPGVAIPKKQMTQVAFEDALNEKLAEYRVDLDRSGRVPLYFVRDLRQTLAGAHRQHPPLSDSSFCGKGMYGLKVHEAALAKGVKVTGATVHLVNEDPRRRPYPAAKGRGGPARRHAGAFTAPGDGAGRMGAAPPGRRDAQQTNHGK